MSEAATLIGSVESVAGAKVSVRLREDMPSTLMMVDGQSYRIGQIGAFARIPLGYTSLYGICTEVGAAAAPAAIAEVAGRSDQRWMTVTLFGESIGGVFERGISQYPTVGDAVHLVTSEGLKAIYSREAATINVGEIAAASGVDARLALRPLVSRHFSVVGSTGAGKSNAVTILLEALASAAFPAARAVIIDPHGEYGSALAHVGEVFRIGDDTNPLVVPFWALPFDELRETTLGQMQPNAESAVRDAIQAAKVEAASHLTSPPPQEAITADSPLPFSIRRLWFDLDDYERTTFQDTGGVNPMALEETGDAANLIPNKYPAHSARNTPPYLRPQRRNLARSLELMQSRLRDARFSFLFSPGGEYTPDLEGRVTQDLGHLVAGWVGHGRPISVFDLSGCPAEVLTVVVGTLLRVIYDTLFWAGELPIAGRQQPLLVVLEEAHIFLPEGRETPAQRTIGRIAKEGRKYGVGLAVVTQRPSEIDATTLSQCGTMVALRLTNRVDRGRVEAAMPDELGNLASILPALRTGEALVLGEALPIPSRIRFRLATNKPAGDDAALPEGWQTPRPDASNYDKAVAAWRRQRRATLEEGDCNG